MKRTISAILTAALLLQSSAMLPVQSSAADTVYEFENGTIHDTGDNVTEAVSLTGASGGKAVSLLDGGDSVTLEVDVPANGRYTLSIRYCQPYDEAGKYQNVLVNGENIGQLFCAYTGDQTFSAADVTTALRAGKNTVTIEASWGWSYLDSLTISEGKSIGNAGSGILSNPNASAQAQSLYSFLCDTYGNYVISGQQESTWMGSIDYEMNIIRNASGKLPVLRGLDYMGDDFSGVNNRAKDWYQKGGIVEICWHCGSDFSGSHTESLETNLNWERALTPGTNEYNALIAGMDKAAQALQELENAGIPVLWRPFHEFDGQWFWWGKGGGEYFIRLWRMMYDRFTHYFKLDNLIWLLGYADDVKGGWYPGDKYVDLIGSDTYRPGPAENVSTTHKTAWDRLAAMDAKKMPFVFHECGKVPDIESLWQEECPWLWFMPWHSKWVKENDPELLRKAYHHKNSITLDRLPRFR